MNDQHTLNIETRNGKYLSLTHRPDGQVDLAIRLTKGGHNLVQQCTITADRKELIARFFERVVDLDL